MPEAEVLADVKGPTFGRETVFVGTGNQRVWASGVGVWSQRTSRFTSIARTICHFESAESRSEVEPFVLWRWIVCRGLTPTANPLDHTRLRSSEQIVGHCRHEEPGKLLGTEVYHGIHGGHGSLKSYGANHERSSQQVSRNRPRNVPDLTLPIAVADARGRSFS